MKTKLACLILLAVAIVLCAQVPPAPPGPPGPTPSKTRISEPVRPIFPNAPSAVSAVTNTATGVSTTKPNTAAPAQFTPPPPAAGSNPTAKPFPAFPAFPTLPAAEPAVSTARAATTNAPGTNGLARPVTAGKDDEDEVFLPDQILDEAVTQFQAAPLDQVLEVYSKLTRRTVLKPASLPAAQITLKAQTKLTVKETLQAIDSVLSLNGIAVIYTGEKFLTVVPTATAGQEGAMFNTNSSKDLPEAGQYITKIVEVKYAKPSEVVSALQPFAKLPGGLLPIDATGVLVMRDNAINIKRMMEVLEKIDKSVPTDEQFKVIPINYALAADVAQVLGSLTSGGAAGGGTGARGGTTGSTRRTTGTGTGTTPFGGTSGMPGSAGFGGATPFGGAAGANPATPGVATPGTASSAFQNRLNAIVSNITGGRSGSAPLLGEARIIPYDRSNSLLVLATTN
jgi:hypothetical protein